MAVETGKLVNYLLIALAAILAICSIVAVGLAANDLVKFKKMKDERPTPRPRPGLGSEYGPGPGPELHDGSTPAPKGRFYSGKEQNMLPVAYAMDDNLQISYQTKVHGEDFDPFAMYTFGDKICLGVAVVLFLASLLQIAICVLSILDKITLMVWLIVNACCIVVYIVCFGVLCNYFTHKYPPGPGDLPKCLMAFCGLLWIVSLITIVFIFFTNKEKTGGESKAPPPPSSKASKTTGKSQGAPSKKPDQSVASKKSPPPPASKAEKAKSTKAKSTGAKK